MGEDPKLRFTIRAKKEKQRNEIDQRVDADERKCHERKPFGPIIHSNWNGDEHAL